MFTPKTAASLLSGARRTGSRNNTPGGLNQSLLNVSGNTSGLAGRLGRTDAGTPLRRTNVLEDTGANILSSWNSTLPVLVTEVLTLSQSSEVSVSLSDSGWAWLVSGRRLVVWRYQSYSTSSKIGQHQARELALPPSDLSHRSELVCVYSASPGHTPCCVAVSPEGQVRYWPSIAHESSSLEVNAELGGQECVSLTDIHPVGCILATASSTLLLIHHQANSSLACRRLQVPAGILGGISRRVSSLLWGGSSGSGSGQSGTGGAESRLVRVALAPNMAAGSNNPEQDWTRAVVVLTASCLQKWRLEAGGIPESANLDTSTSLGSTADRLLYETDVVNLVRDDLWAALKELGSSGSPSWLKIFPLDLAMMDMEAGKAVLLLATYNQNDRVSQGSTVRVRYALAVIQLKGDTPPFTTMGITLLQESCTIGEGEEPRPMRLLAANDRAFIYTREFVTIVSLQQSSSDGDIEPREEDDKISMTSSGDALLGGGILNNANARLAPVFYTSHHGVVTITPANSQETTKLGGVGNNSVLNDTSFGGMTTDLTSTMRMTNTLLNVSNLSLMMSPSVKQPEAGLHTLVTSESKLDQLKAAFLTFCKRDLATAQRLIEDIFPSVEGGSGLTEASESSLDRQVTALSASLINDFPASDPRWLEANTKPQGLGISSSMSLLMLQQLEDKLVCQEHFIGFLKTIGLWDRLSTVTFNGRTIPTVLCLAENTEKTIAAVELRTIHNEYKHVIDEAMKIALEERDLTITGNLTVQDHFYRKISRLDDIFESFVVFLQNSIRSDSPRDQFTNISSINNVVIEVLRKVLNERNRRMEEYKVTGDLASLEYYPWTVHRRDQFRQLAKISIQNGLRAAENPQEKTTVVKQIVELSDMILDGYRSQVWSVRGERREAVDRQMANDREQLVTPLVDRKLYDEAASLAEKYLDFDILVRICEETSDQAKLEGYMERFSKQNFCHHVFSWYVKENKKSRLLSLFGSMSGQHVSLSTSQELARFLTTSGQTDIAWIHEIHTNKYREASKNLLEIAAKESDILARKKTQLSLAKLAALAQDEPMDDDAEDQGMIDDDSHIYKIENELMLVKYQEQIPDSALEQFGMERENMSVLSAREMIEMYIGEGNTEADHYDFKKALDLLKCLASWDQDELQKLRLHIWAQAILRNTWTDIDTNNPIEKLKETLFFRLAELAFFQGHDLPSYLPSPVSLLEAEELGQLREQNTFKFLLQSGYEHMLRVCTAAENITARLNHS